MHQKLIIDKISSILDATDRSHDAKLTEMLDSARRIFIAGAGRSKLVGNFFAMRLVHGGYDVSVVGEIVCLSTELFPVLRIPQRALGRRDGIANQRGLFRGESPRCS